MGHAVTAEAWHTSDHGGWQQDQVMQSLQEAVHFKNTLLLQEQCRLQHEWSSELTGVGETSRLTGWPK